MQRTDADYRTKMQVQRETAYPLSFVIGEHSFAAAFESAHIRLLFDRAFPTLQLGIGRGKPRTLHFEEDYGGPFTDYQITKQPIQGGTRYRRSDYCIEADSSLASFRIKVFDALALKHALMHVYSLIIVHDRWGLLVHSSCMVDQEKAYLFAGHSGAGKSTAAALSAPRGVLADEAAIIRIRHGEVTVFHSPFRSENRSVATEKAEAWPLTGIHLLHQASRHQLSRLSKWDGMLCLMDKVFYWSPTPQESRTLIRLIKAAVDHVPIYDLHFCKDPEFWELIRNEHSHLSLC